MLAKTSDPNIISAVATAGTEERGERRLGEWREAAGVLVVMVEDKIPAMLLR